MYKLILLLFVLVGCSGKESQTYGDNSPVINSVGDIHIGFAYEKDDIVWYDGGEKHAYYKCIKTHDFSDIPPNLDTVHWKLFRLTSNE